jgi:hypothetical protein
MTMSETPIHTCHNATARQGVPDENEPDKDWDQFDACEECHGRAPIEETPDGELICQVCHARLPRPST